MNRAPKRSKSSLNYRRSRQRPTSKPISEIKPKKPVEPELVFDDIAQANDETFRDRLDKQVDEWKDIVRNEVVPVIKKHAITAGEQTKAAAAKVRTSKLPKQALSKVKVKQHLSSLKKIDVKGAAGRAKRINVRSPRAMAYAFTGLIIVVLAFNLLVGGSSDSHDEIILSEVAGTIDEVTDADAPITASQDEVLGANLVVSRQSIPQAIKDDPQALEFMAQNYFGYYESLAQVATDKGIAYVITIGNGQQFGLLAHGEELVLISASRELEARAWVDYINSLE